MRHSSKGLPAIVYLVTNKINGKRYIGVTTKPLRRRMAEHFGAARRGVLKGAFHRAIRKYGRDGFEASILASCATGAEGLQTEVLLIAQLKPEYNSTAGGDGNTGRVMSAEGRQRLSEFHRGKQWNLGHRHSQEAKEAVRAAQFRPDIVVAWRERAAMGPRSLSRPVICLEDQKTYPSAAAAAVAYGVDAPALTQVCLGKRYRKSIGGHRFRYVEAS